MPNCFAFILQSGAKKKHVICRNLDGLWLVYPLLLKHGNGNPPFPNAFPIPTFIDDFQQKTPSFSNEFPIKT
jgi:hypothetical protein